MIVISTMFGVLVALVSIYWSDALVPFAMVGGTAVGLGWAFYPERE